MSGRVTREGYLQPCSRRYAPVELIITLLAIIFIQALQAHAETDDQIADVHHVLEDLLQSLGPECIGYWTPFGRSKTSVVVVGSYRQGDNQQEQRARSLLKSIDRWLERRKDDFERRQQIGPIQNVGGSQQLADQQWEALGGNNGPSQVMLFFELRNETSEGLFLIDFQARHTKPGCQPQRLLRELKLPKLPMGRIRPLAQREPRPLSVEEIKAEMDAMARDPSPSESFRECEDCPVMRILPAGTFLMGTANLFPEDGPDHKPLQVKIKKPFAIGVYEVTLGEFKKFIGKGKIEGNCIITGPFSGAEGPTFASHSFKQRDDEPVVCVSWEDAKHFIDWINSKVSGAPYRLLSEAEWEYAARAGQGPLAYPWGDDPRPDKANYGESEKIHWEATAPGDAFPLNQFKLAHMNGNVREWVEDCWNSSHIDNPGDGRPSENCMESKRVVRGGSWRDTATAVRSAWRTPESPSKRSDIIGFRVARTLSLPPG